MTIDEELTGWLRRSVPDLPPDLGVDTPLIASGLLDSLHLLDLIEFAENLFGVRLAEEDMHPDNFQSVASIAALIARRRGAN